ncbi:hypothetical protein NC652_027749 [Populus alba x Populus x berolinensis]|nr:hypothetical protein NC652_027749 [Populus alba x Populus x berolinensis]
MSSSQAFTPPRTKVVFANFTGPSCGVRVYSKHRNTAMQKNSPSTKSPPLLLLVVAIKVPLVAPDLASHRVNIWSTSGMGLFTPRSSGVTPLAGITSFTSLAKDKTPLGSYWCVATNTPTGKIPQSASEVGLLFAFQSLLG